MNPLDVCSVRERVSTALRLQLERQHEVLEPLGPDVTDLTDVISALMSAGKRLRAGFLYWGYRAAGQRDSDELIQCASAMEFFQAAALIHDDVMDRSELRRGALAAHRELANRHLMRDWQGAAERFGDAGAVLAGNLCLGWAREAYTTCGLPTAQLARGSALFDVMWTQLMAGQFLDVVESHRPWIGVVDAERVARAQRVLTYKSAKYTIEHPLVIGARVGGIACEAEQALARYGLDLGTAFQLRDDILGVFGDPDRTGKPAGDDIREGKRTLLVAYALQGASETGQSILLRHLGAPMLAADDLAEVQEVISSSGALARLEQQITKLADSALAALASAPQIDPSAKAVLGDLVQATTERAA